MSESPLNASKLKEVRRERMDADLAYLAEAIKEWIQLQRDSDFKAGVYIGKHKTQIEAIESVLLGSLEVLQTQLTAIVANVSELGQFFEECRHLEQSILWLQRLWEWFQDKFKQRHESERYKELLSAADEIVWSCYRQTFLNKRAEEAGFKQGPTPLAVIESHFSPAAVHSDKPLTGSLMPARSGLNGDLTEFIQGMPLSYLRLPPWCINSPWWLVFVAHEVGHLIQHELKLVRHYREGLEQAARNNGLPEADIQRWGQWGKEIFADVFSVIMLGPCTLWAVIEFEWSTNEQMKKRKTKYPAPLIRIALMAGLIEKLALPVKEALRGFGLEDRDKNHPVMNRDLSVVSDAVDFFMAPLPHNLGALHTLCAFDAGPFLPNQEVDIWASNLQGNGTLLPAKNLRSTRTVMSASVHAWSDLIKKNLDPKERRQAAEHLAGRTIDALKLSAEPGTRSEHAPSGAMPEGAKELARLILAAGRDEPLVELDL